METLLLLFLILLTVYVIIIVCEKLYPAKSISFDVFHAPRKPRELYLCKDIVCKYEQKYCCMSCGQRNICEVVCDYDGPCDWRVKV